MCPVVAGLALTAVGVGASVYGQVKQGEAAKKAGDKQEAAFNLAADNRLKKVDVDLETSGRTYVRQQGKNIAAIGQSGITQTSFYDVLLDNASERQFEAANIKYSGQLEADELRKSGAIASAQGSAAQTASYIGVGSTIAQGIGGVALSGAFDKSSSGWQTTTYNSAGQIV